MRRPRILLACALILIAESVLADSAQAAPPLPRPTEPDRTAQLPPIVRIAADDENYDIDMIVAFSGRCTTFRAAGQNLPCRAVKYFHGQGGRAYFTIAIDDPTDKGHILSFSGEKARREKNDFYELTIDQMLLNSKDRPRVNAVRVPLVKQANGICRQFGDIEKKRITAVSCVATDRDGLKYELQFEADGEPALVQTIVREPLELAKRRKRLRALTVCKRKATEAQILPRDSTSYIIQCLEEGGVVADE
jgi:hypothetical protein